MMNLKLTDIPIELQSRILSHLCKPPRFFSAPTACTFESAGDILDAFPDDLLHAAQASSDLSKAVINNLGSQAKVLNFQRSERLPEWISLLRNRVKSFSLTGITVLENCGEEECEVFCTCDHLHRVLFKTLKALSMNDVSLTVLSLEEFSVTDPYISIGREEEIAESLIQAIQKSSCSLKDITIHVNRATALALPLVTLPKLEVATISAYGTAFNDEFEVYYPDVPSPTKLEDILQGLNGHSDRNTNASTVRELRLHCLYESPTVDRKSCSSLFSAVQKLILECRPASKHSEIAKFIANFKNLNTLQWITGLICPEDMNIIFEDCPELDNLDLFVSNRQILPGEIPLAQNSSGLNDLFISFRGKLQSFDIKANLSISQMRSLGENNPNLRTLEMEIDYTSIEALYLLLSTHCRRLRELRLWYSTDAVDCLGSNEWPALARAICSASDELHEISLEGDRTGPIIESATSEMVEAIIDILEFMGDRASSIEFRVPINTHNPFTVMDVISRTLNVAKTQCGSIETLCLDYIQDNSLGGYQVDVNQEDRLLNFSVSILDLEKEFNLRSGIKADLGDINSLWEIQE